MTVIPFVCEWINDDQIDVYQINEKKSKRYGHFNVITKPLCPHCGNPDMIKTKTDLICWESHYLHNSLKDVDGVFQLGHYFKKSSIDLKKPGDILNQCIWGLKKNKNWALPISQAMFMVIQKNYPMLLDVDIIVPVPNHVLDPHSEAKAVALADQLGKEYNKIGKLPNVTNALHKLKNISTQQFNQIKREETVKDMFEFNSSKSIENKSILLVDDVLTAGNTKGQCATLLKNNGASKVWIMIAGRNK